MIVVSIYHDTELDLMVTEFIPQDTKITHSLHKEFDTEAFHNIMAFDFHYVITSTFSNPEARKLWHKLVGFNWEIFQNKSLKSKN